MNRPILGITMGDPAGCGPEITVRALSDATVYQRCRPLVIGDIKCIRDALRVTNRSELKLHQVDRPSQGLYEFGTIDVLHLELVDWDRFSYGKVDPMCGNAAFQCVKKVIELAMAGEVDATVTNALNKEAMNLAGHHFNGHTEIYAHYTGTDKYTMMLAHDDLRVVHVSTHVSLRQACDLIKKERVLDVIRIAHKACLELGIAAPKVGVCGLNPHAGEDGMFGREEIEEIAPAIEQAKAEGIELPFLLIGQCFAVGFCKADTATKVCRFILTEKSVFADETGAHGKGFLDIFIVRRVISPEHRVATFILFPGTKHKAVLFAVGRRQHGISEGGKLSVIRDAVGFHLRCVFVESDIFPHRRNLFLNVCNFTAVFIREVLVGVA